MSKVEAMRALREARMAPGAPSPVVRTGSAGAAPLRVPTTARRRAQAPEEVAEGVVDPCGHRSMNGRACTRDSGHVEKNHRYG